MKCFMGPEMQKGSERNGRVFGCGECLTMFHNPGCAKNCFLSHISLSVTMATECSSVPSNHAEMQITDVKSFTGFKSDEICGNGEKLFIHSICRSAKADQLVP